ncbi:MAG: hypothetical protein HYT12_01220 [Candidatus Liptonbacteria bacterium]|nr:hypothetical protein [Candidatus Liptonbacteria bacterium]
MVNKEGIEEMKKVAKQEKETAAEVQKVLKDVQAICDEEVRRINDGPLYEALKSVRLMRETQEKKKILKRKARRERAFYFLKIIGIMVAAAIASLNWF